MRVNSETLRYFRNSPLSYKQPKNANKRTDCGENLLSVKLANFLREMTLTGNCEACWTKIAHETNSNSKAYGCLLRNMGKLAGVPDFIFTWENHCLWLELKNGHGKKLSNDQVFFQNWCVETQSPHVVAYTFDEAIEILKQAGIIEK